MRVQGQSTGSRINKIRLFFHQNHIRQRGFSLLELLVVMTVIGILSAMTIPVYVSHLQKTQLTDATAQLALLANRMEQVYLDQRNYGQNQQCSVSMSNTEFLFSYECQTDGQRYVWRASSQDNEFAYSIDHLGNKKTLRFDGQDNPHAPNCWLLEAGLCL